MRSVLAALLLALAVLAAGEARAQRPVGPDLAAGITDESVSVASDYRGARLTVFGVHWQRGRAKSDVVVVLRGPAEEMVVRRKRRILGLWINTDPVHFEDAPSFFSLVSTRAISDFLDPRSISVYGLDPGSLARLRGATPADTDSSSYRRALVRLKRAQGLYRVSSGGLKLDPDGVFKVQFVIPANAPVGTYKVDVYLFRAGQLVKHKPGEVVISRIGVEKTIYTAAHTYPALYGLGVVALALLTGYAAAVAFRRR